MVVSQDKWQPAEHRLHWDDDRRLSVLSRASFAADAGAGRSAAGGREQELNYDQDFSGEGAECSTFVSYRGAVVMTDAQHPMLCPS